MLTRTHRAAAVLAFTPVLLAGCGGHGSVAEFCAVYQPFDDASAYGGDTRDMVLLVDALVDVAPTDRVEAAAEVLQTALSVYEENGGEDLDYLPEASRDRVRDAARFVDDYADQACR